MLTKFKLIIDDINHDFTNECLKNWDNISCSYKRADLSGVVRSFTSQFEFVGEAYDLLFNLFNEKGFKSQAKFELYTIKDNWEYQRAFFCDLDFSSICWTNTVLRINAIDNNITSIIKANKSTKYEFRVDENIPTSYLYEFDRVQMTETATYSITDGENNSDGSLLGTYKPENNYRIYVGLTNKEIGVGGFVISKEDQEYGDGYMLSCIKTNTIEISFKIDVDIRKGCASLKLMDRDKLVKTLTTDINSAFNVQFKPGYSFNTIDEVIEYISNDETLNHSWGSDIDLWRHRWVDVAGIVWSVVSTTNGTNEWYCTEQTIEDYVTQSFSGTFTANAYSSSRFWLKFDSEVERDYQIRSSEIKFSWKARGGKVYIKTITPINLITAILNKMCECQVSISDYDKRISNTLLLAAESIREIPNAQIYSSFDDFCSWMETVFGYTYYIDEDKQILYFVHRNELFKNNIVKDIINAIDFDYSVDNSTLYSTVIVGYDKQDYDSVNGRDEFNFNNSYSTGFSITDKKIELKSKYRADSYGIEFLVQKRNSDTTDNESDDNIFFVLGKLGGNCYRTVRDVTFQNTNTDTLINGEFSPMKCVLSNADYIGIMANRMILSFTSSEGDSNVKIDGVAISDTLFLEDLELLSSGILKFKTEDTKIPADLNGIVQVQTPQLVYKGYIKNVEVCYSRQTPVEYTLILKSIESC